MNHIDAHPAEGVTVRHYPDSLETTDVYVGGWRVGRYKTANGVRNAVTRATSPEAIEAWAQAVVERANAQMLDDIITGRRRLGASRAEQLAVWNAAITEEGKR